MLIDTGLCIVGFILLYFGAEWLVKGSSSMARSLGVTPLVIGLTVVAFGTSAPEFVVSVVSSLEGKSMIAVGNVVGSNIINIAMVLGMVVLFQPITCDRSVTRRDIPIMLGISVVLLLICLDSRLSRIDGAILFVGIIAYTTMNLRFARSEAKSGRAAEATAEVDKAGYISSRFWQVLLIVVGIAGVVGGAKLVVDAAERIMTVLGVGEKFIGLTVVAFGTSLPELATSVIAAIRKEMNISLGNLVGSNVFNIMSVLGAAALIRPIPIPGGFVESGMVVDYSIMLLTSALPLFMMWRTPTMTRRDGVLLLVIYGGYLAYLIVKG